MNEAGLHQWEVRLAEPNGNGKTACDFAELIWNGSISDRQQCQLLASPVVRVREVTAWAIADLGRDSKAMRLLLAKGTDDSSERVRTWVAFAVKHSQFLTVEEKAIVVKRLINNPNSNVTAMLGDISAWQSEQGSIDTGTNEQG